MNTGVLDSNFEEVKVGNLIQFNYGIPPVKIEAFVTVKNGMPVVRNPHHERRLHPLHRLYTEVGHFTIIKEMGR